MKFKPLNDRILLKRAEEERITKGGIILPDTAKEKPLIGTVISTGEKTSDVKEGDKIVFGKYAGTDVKLNGEDYLIIREDDVIGIINPSRENK